MASFCNNVIVNGFFFVICVRDIDYFHPDKWSEWMLRSEMCTLMDIFCCPSISTPHPLSPAWVLQEADFYRQFLLGCLAVWLPVEFS